MKRADCYLWHVQLDNIFFTVPHKWQDLRENVIEHEMLVLIYFKTFFLKYSSF
jgi:hypothetical protein